MQPDRELRTKIHLDRLYQKAGGVDRVALITGYRATIVKAWRTRGTPNRIPFDALCDLEHAVGDYECSREHLAGTPDRTPPAIDLNLVRELARDSAHVVDTTLRALDDGHVCRREKREIAPLARELMVGASQLLDAACQGDVAAAI